MPVAGDRVGPYVLERALGGGGFGSVWQAASPSGPVALKLLHAHLSANDSARRRFLREAEVGARVEHPNLVRTLQAGLADIDGSTVPYLATELLSGQTLDERVGSAPPDEARCLDVGRQLASALVALHAARVVHRDVKPANVMELPDGSVKLLDLGVVRLLDAALTGLSADGGFVGSLRYAAPEQLFGQPDTLDERVDQYGLGLTLYELASGVSPFPGEDPPTLYAQKMHQEVDPPSRAAPRLSPFFDELIGRLMARDPARRFGSMRQVVEALDRGALRATSDVATARRSALPAERDAFVGRGAELRDLAVALAAPGLVTLTGPAGTGKTRLAVHAARAAPVPAILAELVEARAVEGVVAAVAAALSLTLAGRDPVAQIGRALAARGRQVLVLDNFEQVVSAAPDTVGRWRDLAPETTFLATSRQPLDLPGEQAYPVPPLGLPSADAELAAILGSEAVALFVARARRSNPSFALDDRNARAVAALVTELDGLPLAIELVAARAAVMDAERMRERLGQRFRLLATSSEQVQGRHRTLRGAIAWSWDLLSADEQRALAQCAVFEGGFTLEAAEAVLDVADAWPADLVQALIDRSLVEADAAEGGPRFRLLVSIQAFARERLDEADAGPTEARHGAWFARFADRAALDALRRHGGLARRRALKREGDNLAAALRRAIARGDAEVAVRAATAAMFASGLQPYPVVLASIRATRPHLDGAEPGTRAFFLNAAGSVLTRAGQREEAIAHYERALRIAVEQGDRTLAARANGHLGTMLAWSNPPEAVAALERVVGELAAEGDRLYQAIFLDNMAMARRALGDTPGAVEALHVAIPMHRDVGDAYSEALALNSLGAVLLDEGRIEQALEPLTRSNALLEGIGDAILLTATAMNLGNAMFIQGTWRQALDVYRGALQAALQAGLPEEEAMVRINRGQLRQSLGESAADGDFSAAEALTAADWPGNAALATLGRAELARDRGELDVALGHARRALRHAEAARDAYQLIGANAEIATCLAHSGDLEGARRYLDDARAAAGAQPVSFFQFALLNLAALIAAREGRFDEARDGGVEALAAATTGGLGPRHEAAVLLTLAERTADRGDVPEARRWLDEARKRIEPLHLPPAAPLVRELATIEARLR